MHHETDYVWNIFLCLQVCIIFYKLCILHLGDVFCYIQHMYFKCIMFYACVLCKYIIPSNISFIHLMKLWYHYESWFTCFMHNVLNMIPMYHFCFTCFLHHVSRTMYASCIIYIGPILSVFYITIISHIF